MKRYNILICIIAILTSFSSCDFLDLEPEDGVIREKFWKTKEEVYSSVMGCYAAMMDDAAMRRYFVWGEARAEMAICPPTRTWVNWQNIQNGEIATTESLASWSSLYTVINNCNTVLTFAKETQKVDESFSLSALKEYEAEAVCVRSLMYFYLVRTFGDVPYVTTATTDDDQEVFIAKSSQEVVLDSLIACLKRVDRTANNSNYGIPYSYPKLEHNKGRFTVWGLKALLADIYLWKGDYENCLKECNQILNSGQFSLVPIEKSEVLVDDGFGNIITMTYPSESDANNFFLSMYANGNSVESIFELQFGTDYNNPFYSLFNPGSGSLVANTDVLYNDLFPSSNIDKGSYDIRTEGVSYKQGLIWKWIGLDRLDLSKMRIENESFSNWIFYRLADVYLMKAEALNQLAGTDNSDPRLVEALECVRVVRERANAPESTDAIPEGTPIDAKALEKFILEERAREFTHEGKRWFDVLRYAKRDNYAGGNIDYLLTLAVYAAKPEKAVSLQNKWKGDHNSHYFPIQEDEMRSNKALVQNPFYLK